MRSVLMLLISALLLAENATHLLTPPPPLKGEAAEKDTTSLPSHTDNSAVDQIEEEKNKREALNQPVQIETESEGDVEKIIKNPKFKFNIPF